MTTPPNIPAIVIPLSVAIGINALGRACPFTNIRSVSPLARAVTTYSCRSVSNIEERVTLR